MRPIGSGSAPSRIFSSRIRFTIGPFLKPVAADLGLETLLLAVALSLSIDETARPACRAVRMPSRPYPVAGGR